MSALEEIIKYCEEPNPVGALLVSGEWGCGKTYLIEHGLKDALQEKAFILRISLFGKMSIDSIQKEVKNAWFEARWGCGDNKISRGMKKMWTAISNLKFEQVQGITETEWLEVFGVSINNQIEYTENKEKKSKKVILVFDDLERCAINCVDVLGCINDYCENQGFHTIIIANQDKMRHRLNCEQFDIEIVKDKKGEENISSNVLVKRITNGEEEKISYKEIKEKIVQRTVHYIPNYKEIIHAIIISLPQFGNNHEYNDFILQCERGLVALFDLDDNFVSVEEERKPHNIRSLKCAIVDFYRIYVLLNENEIECIDKWLYSFTSYVIAYKANMVQLSKYGTLFSDDKVRKIYPAFQNDYMFSAAKKWILSGNWDEDLLKSELEHFKERKRATNPKDIIKTNRIIDIEEEIICVGFPELLEEAYLGKLSLDEYINFIWNSCYARNYGFVFPIEIEWRKVEDGIIKAIEKLLEKKVEGQQVHRIISPESRTDFIQEELSAYILIEEFNNGERILLNNNRIQYLEDMMKDPISALQQHQNKRFQLFDVEMAKVTAIAFIKADNSAKRYFADTFKSIIKNSIAYGKMDVSETKKGLNKLLVWLKAYRKKMKRKNKIFAMRYTEDFISAIQELSDRIDGC